VRQLSTTPRRYARAAMRALVCARLGDPTLALGAPGAALEVRELPTPTLGEKDVLIQARAARLAPRASRLAPRAAATRCARAPAARGCCR
jgi:hypothetical protein